MPKTHKPSRDQRIQHSKIVLPREPLRFETLEPLRDTWTHHRSVHKGEADRHFSPEGYELLKEYDDER
jgi:hypothetical protein